MWQPTPPTVPKPRSWKLTPPTVAPVAKPWKVKWTRRAIDAGVGADAAKLDSVWIPAVGNGFGLDRAGLSALRTSAAGTGLGADRGLIVPDLYTADTGIGADLGRLGVRPADSGIGADISQARPRYAAIDRAVGADMLTSLKPRTSARDTGLGADSATSGFSAISVVTANWAAVGTYTFKIPVACRYIDVVLVGSGGGGAGSGWFYTLGGVPGGAGSWATITLERGVDIPWTAITITLTIAAGGSSGVGGGPTGGAGTAGGNTVLSYTNLAGATATVTANGGVGGPITGGISVQTGQGPGNQTYNGQTYPGGANQTTAGGTGNAAGGAGAGGKNFGGAGGAGAPGGAWCRAYQ